MKKLEACNHFTLVPEIAAMTPVTIYFHIEQRKGLRFHVFDMFHSDVKLSVTSTQEGGQPHGGRVPHKSIG